VLQLPLLPVVDDAGPRDAMRALFALRGFRAISGTDVLDLRPSNGCLFTRLDASSAELLVTISDQVGVSRIPLTGVDVQWLERVVAEGHVGVLLVSTAVAPDGTTTQEDLRRDVDAGVVHAALVPSGDPT
jgi:hypothetical protein